MKPNILLLAIILLITETFNLNGQDRNDHQKSCSKKVVYVNENPKIGAIWELPSTSKKVVYNKINYYLYKGRYYRTLQGKHILVAPPKGLRINALPSGYDSLTLGLDSFYYYEGVYYASSLELGGFEVINAPIGTTINKLPRDAEVVIYQGKIGYIYLGVLYREIQKNHGDAYEVVGRLEN